jgi:FeS assembly SUF system protein
VIPGAAAGSESLPLATEHDIMNDANDGRQESQASDPAADKENQAPDPNPELRQRIIEVLKTCYDPEIPVDIYELGLIYAIDVDAAGNVAVKMTLTSPMCPVAGSLPPEVEEKIAAVDGVREARVDLVWEPPWDKEMMSLEAKLRLNLM